MRKNKPRPARARPPADRHLGYEVNYFAWKHGIGRATAELLIATIGKDRVKLDAAGVLFSKL
jgi:hypothetical protein